MAKANVEWDGEDFLLGNIKSYDKNAKRIITGQFMNARGDFTKYAKQNAPWTDRTGNARAGLHTIVNIPPNPTHWEIILAHSVPYGIWLEVRFSGRYAIIEPTIIHEGRLLLQRIASSLNRIGALE
jgi:hypothetical protein